MAKKEKTWNDIKRRPLSKISIEDLPVCYMTIQDLKRNGFDLASDIVDYARKHGRIFYLHGMRKCDEQEVIDALKDCGVRYLYPAKDPVEFMEIYHKAAFEDYRIAIKETMRMSGQLNSARQLTDVFKNQSTARAICRAIEGTTIGELIVYGYVHDFNSMDGIGDKRRKELIEVLTEYGYTKEFTQLMPVDQKYIRACALSKSLHELDPSVNLTIKLCGKGLDTFYDLALYLRAGFNLFDLSNEFDLDKVENEILHDMQDILNKVDAIRCPAL